MLVIELRLSKKECIDYEDLQKKEMLIVSLSGDLYYSYGNGRPELHSWGQIDMSLKELNRREWEFPEELETLLLLWERCHLNDLQAGTRRQTKALQEKDKTLLHTKNYEKAVQYLKEIGLYEDRGYKYGMGWLCKRIKDEAIAELKRVMG